MEEQALARVSGFHTFGEGVEQVWKERAMSEERKPGHMRQAMPTVAGWIDELRAEFGAEAIDASIRAGLRGEPNRFRAREGELEIGTAFEETRRVELCV